MGEVVTARWGFAWRSFVWTYPFVFAAYPILAIYAGNRDQLDLPSLVFPLAIALAGTVVLVVACRVVSSTRARARLLASLVVVVFYVYGHLYGFAFGLVESTWRGTTDNTSFDLLLHSGLSALSLAVIVLGRRMLRRRAGSLATAERFAATLGVVLLVFAIPQVFRVASDEPTEAVPRATTTRDDPPDIYVLVLDSYPRSDALEKAYGFDNRPLIDFLESHAFQVADSSRSNYQWTFLSLASLLNMAYLHDLQVDPGPASNDRTPVFAMIRHNRVVRLLKEAGYVYVHLNSSYHGTAHTDAADIVLQCSAFDATALERLLIQTTWLRVVDHWLARDLGECHKESFTELSRATKIPGPKFVFAHIIPPHPPFLFNRHGDILRTATVADQFDLENNEFDDGEAYVEQLLYVNERVREFVLSVEEADSPESSVVVILSDHGTRPSEKGELRFDNFLAIRLPDGPRISDRMTPVNTFRLILSEYLGMEFELLPNESYMSTWSRPYDFYRFHGSETGDRDGDQP